MWTYRLSALFGDLEFFKLPPEIRDMIYDLLFGLPEHEFFTFYDGRVVILNENNVRGSYGMTDLFLGYPPAGYLYPPLQRPFRQPAPLRPALPRRNPVAVYAGEAAGRRAPQLPVALLRGNSHLRSEASPALYARNRFVLKPFSVADMMSSSAARYATRYRRAIAISSQLPSAFPQQNLVKLSVVITLSDMSAWMVTGNLSVDCTAIGAFKSIKELRISVTDPQDSDRSAAEVVKDVSLLGVVAGLLQLVGPDTEVVWTDDAPFTNHYEKAVSKDALRTMSWMRAASGVHTNVVPTQP